MCVRVRVVCRRKECDNTMPNLVQRCVLATDTISTCGVGHVLSVRVHAFPSPCCSQLNITVSHAPHVTHTVEHKTTVRRRRSYTVPAAGFMQHETGHSPMKVPLCHHLSCRSLYECSHGYI